MNKKVVVVLATLCILALLLMFRNCVDTSTTVKRSVVWRQELQENAVRINRLHDAVITDENLQENIDLASALFHQRLSLQHKIHNVPFRSFGPLNIQSLCIVSMHGYTSGPMKLLLRNLTQHKRDFSFLHNMGFIDVDAGVYRHKYANQSSTWWKLPALRDIIAKDAHNEFEWYMWVDADVVFTNITCTFQELLSTNHRAMFAGDFNGGVFFIRNHPWSLQFLDAWLSTWPALQHTFGQQDEAYATLLLNNRFAPYMYAHAKDKLSSIQSYPSKTDEVYAWHPGHCVLHAAGFWQHKTSILQACLHSEYACVAELNRVYAALNGTAYLQLTAQLHRGGYDRHVLARK